MAKRQTILLIAAAVFTAFLAVNIVRGVMTGDWNF
jgi:hypothetical protein